jgi:hypothetical protein
MIIHHKSSLFIIIILLTIGALQACSPVTSNSQSPAVSTSAQNKYSEAFITYTEQLNQEGLIAVKEIRVKDSQPFIFILKSQTQEVTDENVKDITELALGTVSVFESGKGLKHDDIDIAFHRPVEQKIVIINRRDLPELLSADTYREMTVSMDKGYFTSLINLGGPTKNGNQDFSTAWSLIQAVCLAYAGGYQDSDPVCNIISANAAAGWVGIEEQEAAKMINSYGMTELSYLGSKDYRYRFIDFVYQEFVH